MPNRYNNWTFKEVESFLREHNFQLHHTNGSHFYYIDARMKMVCVPFHGKKTIKPRTMKGIILQSAIPNAVWFS